MKSEKERLLSKITINPITGCWEWQGTKRRGYGRLTVGSRFDGTRRTASAHRLSFEVFNGAIPDGHEICHKCDNRKCINPEHLFSGVRQDNVNDREKKGRNITHSGESNPAAKLTKSKVLKIRQRKAQEMVSFEQLAKEYGVAKRTIQRAVSGETWKCVKYCPAAPNEGAEK